MVKAKSWPSAPISVRSTQAVNRPAAAPSRKNGTNGPTSRRHDKRPRCHQKITSRAAGSVAAVVLLNSPKTNRASAPQ